MPNRMNPIAKYLFALSAMIVAWTAYAKVAVPFLEGPPTVVRRQQMAINHPDVADILDKSHLPSVVPADAWELETCRTLLTPQGTVYFKTWQPIDDQGTYELIPFTIVMNDPVNNIRDKDSLKEPTKKQPAPIVLRSLEGARLKFSKPLTARSKKDDIELESAQLDGQVTLFRPANAGTDEDELRIVTKNIQISRSQIYTLSEVYFSFGPHHGSGRNLSIDLNHKLDEDSPAKTFSNIEGVEKMELAFVSELVLQPADSKSYDPNRKRQPESRLDPSQTLTLSNQKTPLRLSCEGPFVFRMAEQKAWFRDNVLVTQLDDFQDNLRCESLQIDFNKNATSDTTEVQNLVAIGTPEKPATIVSNSRQTLIVGESLNFDVQQSIAKVAGSTPVSIRSPKFAFEATEFEYRLAEQGKLGALVAEGPGILRGLTDDQKNFEVKWERRLTTRDLDAERIQIDVDQNAFVKFDLHNHIAADTLKFLVWQLPDPRSKPGKEQWKYFPSQLDTRGNVSILSEKLEGKAKELVANWPRPSTRQLETFEHTVSYRAVAQQEQEADKFRALPTQMPTMKFYGDKVVASVAGSLNKLEIRDLLVDGSLALESTATDRRPFAISGQSMKLVPQGKELYRATIDGDAARPATFETDGFDLTGSSLQLDQTANTIWVQGDGALNIEPAKDSDIAAGTRKAPKLDNANVKWSGGMVFDGARIYFEKEVELLANRPPNDNGHRSTMKTNSEALTIELTEPIRFEKFDDDNGAAERKEPEIRRMVFVNEVDDYSRAFKLASHEEGSNGQRKVIAFQNANFDANGKVLDLQKLFVPMATVDAQTGEVVTTGPGQALSYQYSSGKNRLSGSSRDDRSSDSSKKKLSCVHSRFDGQLIANSEKGTMEIDRNTRSAWANVNRFDQTLDPDRPDKLPVGTAVLKSDVLKFAQWTPRNAEPRQEMQAEGNTSIKSDLFEAVADRLTYTDDTDILIIEGKPPADAVLSHRRSVNAKAETVRAQKFHYRLSDRTAQGINIRSVEAGLTRDKK